MRNDGVMSSATSVASIWRACCDELKMRVHPTTFDQWFSGIVSLGFADDDTVLFGVSDDFFAGWLVDHYGDLLQDVVRNASGRDLKIEFRTGYVPDTPPAGADPGPSVPGVSVPFPLRDGRSSYVANSRYTFTTFVVGEENRYAYTASEIAARSPGIYNPLYIHGGTGMGKTHLLQAIAFEILQRDPRKVIEFITCENFLNAFVESLKQKKHSEFRNRFRNSDVLLIDDVHHLAGKDQLQEEFFNTFNNLHHASRQIVLTSDKPPSEIKGLEKRLVSRFESGVSTEITAPEFETRLAILQMKQREHRIELDPAVLKFLASRITSNIRRLEGALLKLVIYSSAMGKQQLSVDFAETFLADILNEESFGHKVSVDDVQRRVADHFDLRVSDLRGSKRPRNIAVPRMIAMYLSRELTGLSYPEIGDLFGGKNHATIIHGHRKIRELMDRDPTFRSTVDKLRGKLQYN